MGQTCCGPRGNKEVIQRLVNSDKFKKGQEDKEAAEQIWEFYAGKGNEEVSLTDMENSTVQTDLLMAQKKLIQTRDASLTGYTEDEEGSKNMEKEKDMSKLRSKQLLDGIAVKLNNGHISTVDFCLSLFGWKDKENKIKNSKLSKKQFIEKYCASAKIGLQIAAGNDFNEEKQNALEAGKK
jgi:hypothetical protein